MKIAKLHDKYYKKILIFPTILILISLIYLINFNAINGDFIYKDISLTGGTTITIYGEINQAELENFLLGKLEDLNTRQVYDFTTREQKAIIIETTSEGEYALDLIEEFLGSELKEGENFDFEFTGSSLSENFYKQLLFAILLAFILMAVVVFIIFRTAIPSLAVIISAFANILMALVFVNLIGMKMSTAGIVAFLMLIGYSVDTDILLTNRVLKRKEGTINQRIFGAFKTGMTMTLTSLFAFLFALFLVKSFSNVLTQIFSILVIGLGFDLINTWITNVSIIKWYAERKK